MLGERFLFCRYWNFEPILTTLYLESSLKEKCVVTNTGGVVATRRTVKTLGKTKVKVLKGLKFGSYRECMKEIDVGNLF